MLSRRSHILAVPLGMLFTGAHPTKTNKLCLDGPAFGHPKFLGVQNALTIQTYLARVSSAEGGFRSDLHVVATPGHTKPNLSFCEHLLKTTAPTVEVQATSTQ